MTNHFIGRLVVNIPRRRNPIAMGDGMAQHPFYPMGASMLSRNQEAVELHVLQQREIEATPINGVQ
jgi:hypothetical protein